jgi:hypothetical protein
LFFSRALHILSLFFIFFLPSSSSFFFFFFVFVFVFFFVSLLLLLPFLRLWLWRAAASAAATDQGFFFACPSSSQEEEEAAAIARRDSSSSSSSCLLLPSFPAEEGSSMFKNQLQELAQRSCFNLPSYTCIREGPDHAPRFKATVSFNGEVFESPGYHTTLRQAEHAAAEMALAKLSTRGPVQSLAARILVRGESEPKRFGSRSRRLP